MVDPLGARQVGKTTLARQVLTSWRGKKVLFDLEDPVDRRKLEDPGLVLREAQGLVVLDEVQRLPDQLDHGGPNAGGRCDRHSARNRAHPVGAGARSRSQGHVG
ncbi:MAG: AAA family ATPase [Planctomycetes bacterium]|nr:AAA family ATPase [Planctomycetota bacterium]